MEDRSQVWIFPIFEDEQISVLAQSKNLIGKYKTMAFALVAPSVGKDYISKLREIFDYIMFAENVSVDASNLEIKDTLLLQCLRFCWFSNIIFVDPMLFHQLSDKRFADPGTVVVNSQGDWVAVAFRPNVSNWKKIAYEVTNNGRKCSSKEFLNVFMSHFGGVVKDINALTIGKLSNFLNFESECGNDPEQDTKTWVAIVGMACRFPGANSVEEYWEILKNGVCTASAPSPKRASLLNSVENVNANYLKCAIDEFDAHFFGFAPSEAAFTDVQARLLLEVSWEAFEDAGVNLAKFRGAPVGIFHGSWIQDYKECLNNVQPSDQDFLRKYIGNGFGSTAAKLSFFYGFTGPNVATDSGCSSSTIGVQLACKSLLEGECPLAVATGSNIILQFDTMSGMVWAEDGICKTFDANANGYGRAEGVAALVLKRYSDAIRDNDRIHGIIRGSASTQEGLSPSFGRPTIESEAMAMKNALLNSGTSPEEVDYVEAHGTGTGVGDPVEASAIVKAYSSNPSLRTTPLWIGSGKTNIGHTESVSGLAAMIKVLLSLKHELIPPHINLKQLNPRINFEQIPGQIVLTATPWTRSSNRVRIAGVSNFGITGTDVHVIIQEAPMNQVNKSLYKPPIHLLAFSAKTEVALKHLTNSYIKYLQSSEMENQPLDNFAYTVNARRTHHSNLRKVVIGRNKNEILTSLMKPIELLPNQQLGPIKICVFFPHQLISNLGVRAHYSLLYSSWPFFKNKMDECDQFSRKIVGLSPSEILIGSQNSKEISELENLVCSLSVAISLFKLWNSWGVAADLIFAQGIGELAGRVAAGLLTITEAFNLIADSLSGGNLMAALKNQNVTGPIKYITLEVENINLESVRASVTHQNSNFYIQIGLQKVVLKENCELNGNSLSHFEDAWLPLISTLGSLYETGYEVDWDGFYNGFQTQFQLLSLPHYPFQRKPYWFPREKLRKAELENPWETYQIHPLLGYHFNTALNSGDEIYQNWLTTSPSKALFLKDHVIGNEVIFPAAGYLEMALASHNLNMPQKTENRILIIENFVVHHPLQLESSHYKSIQTVVSSSSGVSIYSSVNKTQGRPGNKKENWKMHASATIKETKIFETPLDNVETLKSEVSSENLIKFYDDLDQVGLRFGPRFQSLQKIAKRNDETLAQLANIPEAELEDYICHPLLLDAMLQCFLFAKKFESVSLQVPVAIKKFICFSRHSSFSMPFYVYLNSQTVYLLDCKNNLIALMNEPLFKQTTVRSVLKAASVNPRTNLEFVEPEKYEIYWKPSESSSQPDSSLILSETENYTDTPSFNNILQYFVKRNAFSQREKELDGTIKQLVGLFVINCLYKLGWQPQVNKIIDIEELAKELNIVEPLVPAFRHFLICHLVSNSVAKKSSKITTNLIVIREPESPKETKAAIDQILANASQYAPLGKVIAPIGFQLAALFKGKLKHADVFSSQKESGFHFTEVYMKTSRFFNNKLNAPLQIFTEVVKELWKRHGDRASKVMRILEIGEGALNFTTKAVAVLDEHAVEYEYYLSDSCSSRLEMAAGQLDLKSNNVILRKLDIGADPVEQGFPPSHFDILVVQNALHTRKNLRTSMENLKILTKTGGMVIIEEMNGPVPELDIVFGVSEQFWNYEDLDVRPNHPVLDVDQLARLMEDVSLRPVHKIMHSGSNVGILVGQKLRSTSQLDSGDKKQLTLKIPLKSWLLIHDNEEITEKIKLRMTCLGRELVALHFGEFSVPDLLKNINENLEGILFVVEDAFGMDADNYRIFLEPLFQTSKYLMKNSSMIPKLIIASKGCSPLAGSLWGYVRTAQFEMPMLPFKLIDLDPSVGVEERLHCLFHEIWVVADDETEIQYRNQIRAAKRLRKSTIGFKTTRLEIKLSETNDYFLRLPLSNLISELSYTIETVTTPLRSNELEIRVKSVSLNFKDVLHVLKPSPEFEKFDTLGVDFAGVITAVGENMRESWNVGDSVFGLAKQQTVLRGLLRYSNGILTHIPKHLTFSEAATFPAAFLTAWHCIVNVARAQKGQTILIHAASGGVGLMAIQIARFLGLIVIGTAGSERKRNYLRHLGVQHVFGSRTLEFGRKIMEVTNGQGVDLVLNSLTGPGFKETTLEVVKDGGYFVEISKLDIWRESDVQKMRPRVFYEIVYIGDLEDSFLKSMLEHLTVLVEEGSIKAIPFTQFSASRIVAALTFLQKAKQIGKVIVEMPEYDIPEKELREKLFNSQSTYLISGGKGAIGLAIAEWMVAHGAKFLVLVGRSPPIGKALEKIKQLEEKGAKAICLETDISDYGQCKKVLEDIEFVHNLPPLRGVHHCAGVLSDKTIIHQEWEGFEYVQAPKVRGAYNLHKLTVGKSLEFFVLHSSLATTLGNAGQSNYTAANAYMEALIEMRHGMGLNGLCLSWGQWNAGLGENLDLKVAHPFTVKQGIEALEHIFLENKEQPCVVVGSIKIGELVKLRPTYETTLLEGIIKEARKNGGVNERDQDSLNAGENRTSFLEVYQNAVGLQEKENAITVFLKELLADTLGVEVQEIEEDTLFVNMGMDSLLSIDFYNRLQTQLEQAKLAFADMEEYDTVIKLVEFIKKSLDSAH